MRVRAMITNGGPHPPEKWADKTAEQLVDVIQIETTFLNFEAALQARNLLRDSLAEVLVAHHSNVQAKERSHLKTVGNVRLAHPLDPSEHLDDAIEVVNAAVGATMFKDHFAKPEVQQFVRSTLGSHFATAMHIERSWHADGNEIVGGKPVRRADHDPNDQRVAAFRAQHHPGA